MHVSITTSTPLFSQVSRKEWTRQSSDRPGGTDFSLVSTPRSRPSLYKDRRVDSGTVGCVGGGSWAGAWGGMREVPPDSSQHCFPFGKEL